jgi:PAS domain S-box-containing protein
VTESAKILNQTSTPSIRRERNVAPTPRVRPFLPYLISVVCVAAAAALTAGVPLLKEKTSLIMFFAAVIVSSYVGGLGPALLAVFLSALAWIIFVVPPNYSYLLESPSDVLRLVLFVLVAVLTSSLYEQLERARREIRRQQYRLQLALEAGHMGVWDYDLLGDGFWISPELRQIFRIGADEFTPTYGAFLAFVHPDDRPMVVHAMTTSRENQVDYQIEHRLIRRDGSVGWIATRGRTFVRADGLAERMIGLVVDVTDRHTETASAESSPKLRANPPGTQPTPTAG